MRPVVVRPRRIIGSDRLRSPVGSNGYRVENGEERLCAPATSRHRIRAFASEILAGLAEPLHNAVCSDFELGPLSYLEGGLILAVVAIGTDVKIGNADASAASAADTHYRPAAVSHAQPFEGHVHTVRLKLENRRSPQR